MTNETATQPNSVSITVTNETAYEGNHADSVQSNPKRFPACMQYIIYKPNQIQLDCCFFFYKTCVKCLEILSEYSYNIFGDPIR